MMERLSDRGAVDSAAGPPDDRPAGPRGRRRADTVLGCIVSFAVHVVVLLCLGGITWMSGGLDASSAARERDVAIVTEDRRVPIESGGIGPAQVEALHGELAVPVLKDTEPAQPVWQVSPGGQSTSKVDRIISIDVGSGGAAPAGMKGDWASFAAGGGGIGGGGASFFGLEARGGKFVYVVDRSGSMLGPKLDAAKAELIRSIQAMERGVRFYVIFFSGDREAMPAAGLLRATEANKRACFDWVRSISASGSTDPSTAMRLALSLKPDAVWLLSDGEFNHDADVDGAVAASNPGRKVQVHTIAYYSRAGEPALKRIAADHRGRYRFVSPASIGLKP